MLHPWEKFIAATRQGSLAFPVPVVSRTEASVFAMVAMNEGSIIVSCDNCSVLTDRRYSWSLFSMVEWVSSCNCVG
jgi:hypothetical protein